MAYHARVALLALVVCSALAATPAGAEDFSRTFSITPPPPWVEEAGDGMIVAPTRGTDDSSIFLLADYQENVATGELYSRFVDEVKTMEGVQNESTIMVDYDPAYQTLAFHHIRVVRGGKSSSRLSKNVVSLLRRETDLEWSMLDGTVTASIVLKDVRPGDRIDYAYTVKGRNPVLKGLFTDSFSYSWAMAVGSERVRILCPSSRALKYRTVGGDASPRITKSRGVTEYLWEFEDTPPVPLEDGTPSWTVTNPWIEISEYADWSAVASWALSLYPSARLPAELEKLVAQWTGETTDPLERLEDALDYVQQEIRYLGIELGTGSYKPRSPSVVNAQRFGDCKDKTYLLCAILARMGLEAHPVLVNTYSGPILDTLLPSPHDFNHVIVAVSVNGSTIYVDPTQSYQRGPVRGRFVPDYGFGLLVAPGQAGLLKFGSHQGNAPEMEIVERFTVNGQEEPALLEVETTARGGAAEGMRADFASTSSGEIARNYLDFYAASYPKIESAGNLEVRDDTNRNVFVTVEQYKVPGLWTLLEDKRNFKAEFFPESVYDEIPMPRSKKRTSPMEVEYPRKVRERIEVLFSEPWPITPEKSTIATSAFTLDMDCFAENTAKASKVVLDYTYTASAKEVSVSDVPAYNEAVKDIDSRLGYSLTWQAAGVEKTEEHAEGTILIIMGLSTVLFFICGSAVYRIAARPKAAPGSAQPPAPALSGAAPAPDAPHPAPQPVSAGLPPPGRAQYTGLGGWLVVVAIGLFLQPILTGVSLAELRPLFTIGNWHDLTDPSGARYNPLWSPYIMFTIIGNLALIVGSILLLILFFQRRRMFPKAYIVFLLFEAVCMAADLIFSKILLGSAADDASGGLYRSVSQTVVSCALWIPYMLVSQRVRNTFTT